MERLSKLLEALGLLPDSLETGRMEAYTNKELLVYQLQSLVARIGESRSAGETIPFIKSTSTHHRRFFNSDKFEFPPLDIEMLKDNLGITIHNRFFLCRTITSCVKMMESLLVVAEDPAGKQAVRLSLYNYESSKYKNFEEIILPGTILSIINPCFTEADDGGLSVCCYEPQLVVILDNNTTEKLFPVEQWNGDISSIYENLAVGASKYEKRDAVEYKRLGNLSFIGKKYVEAIKLYTLGLQLDAENLDLLSNRANCFIHLGCYSRAMADVTKVLEFDAFHNKAIYRTVKALWGLGRYQEAEDFLIKKFSENTSLEKSKTLAELKQQSKKLLKQNITGQYDMLHILNHKAWEVVEIAEFTSESLEVVPVQGKGRGMIATKALRAGQLLICSKAFAFNVVKLDEESVPGYSTELNSPSHETLVRSIADRIALEPGLGKQIYQLFAGPELGSLAPDDENIEKVDLKRIDSLVSFNSFCKATVSDQVGESIPSVTSGLWITPSFMNHSCCDSNVMWGINGDVMILRAITPIAKGEELFISYMNPAWEYEKRQRMFKSHAFDCDCRRCVLEVEEGVEIAMSRTKIIKSLQKTKKTWSTKTCFDEELGKVRILESLQLRFPKLNYILAHPIVAELARQMFRANDHDNCLKLFEKIHFVTKDTSFAYVALDASLNILGCHMMRDLQLRTANKKCNLELTKKSVERLRHDLLITYGCLEAIYYVCPRVVKRLKLLGIDLFE